MSETKAFEKPKPTDAELRGELEVLTAKLGRQQAGVKEIEDRISELKKLLPKEGR